MTNYNFSTLNSPKHLVAIGKEPGKRMNRTRYNDVWSRIQDAIRRNMGISTSYFSLVPTLNNRTDYGDMDIIISKDALPDAWKARLSTKVFGGTSGHTLAGTDTTVYTYGDFQVNIHIVNTVYDLRRAVIYLGYEGLMGLMQILGESLGFQYDMNNFKLITGIPDKPTLDIAYNQYLELRLLGMSPDFVVYHLYTEADLYKAIYTSQFFNRKVFLDLEAKPDYAERVAKNPRLKGFVDYLKANPRLSGEVKFDRESIAHRNILTNTFNSYASVTFSEYSKLVQTHRLMELTNVKFNVEKMAEVTGLNGAELKKLMDVFAQDGFASEKEFNHFIITSLPETINARILAVKAKMEEEARVAEEAAKAAKAAKAAETRAKKKPLTEKQIKKVEAEKVKAELKTAKPKAVKKASAARPIVEASDNSFALAA